MADSVGPAGSGVGVGSAVTTGVGEGVAASVGAGAADSVDVDAGVSSRGAPS